ncbi:DgyrCDS9385 [Dimorphilus gyrociliatus]|uniref:AP complex subunit beta n=1 Tax=Dimorphilus gyrociliatus TaxID=2664684 RepID=A0A7I8VX66_9ANNE|nr:DgyrCDS9385 [Dimorphilus gyrociliatus]
MTDSKYFTTTKKGEIFELKAELNCEKKDRKREAVKKVIASMTVGKDVSALFTDVVNCMQTDNLELKKLVYLYLMNYAKSQPDLAILAVNTFVKDCDDSNPLIRALAVRTMGCIRVDKITEYLCEPLRKCLKDEDPYVRKTAAVCVAKLHDINSQLVEDQGFLDMLKELVSDSNPMVVANAVAAICEILDVSDLDSSHDTLRIDSHIINKLLTALNECTEWGQIFILDAISSYNPEDEREAGTICDRVIPRLAHANSAVVLSAIKVIMKLIDMLDTNSDQVSILIKKMSPPLVTLLSADSETQFVALRNINLIIQKRHDVLKHEMKVFFVKYNDPIYVKLEKLDIMIRLTNQSNIAQVLAELKEYATEVDVDFVRKSVRAIGRCAIKVEVAAERCVSTLLELIQTKVNYVVQEAIVVIKDIFRKYPNKYESIISTLCENLDTLDEPEARASMIWIIGEYAERIDNADELLEGFLEGFTDESVQVQLQLLTAIVKLFLKRPTETPSELVQQVLSLATHESDNPDLRDRGYIYWRLLSSDPQAAKEVVLSEKPLISEETEMVEPSLLDELICHISTLASVFHKPSSAFVEGKSTVIKKLTRSVTPVQTTDEQIPEKTKQVKQPPSNDLIDDLLQMDFTPAPKQPAPSNTTSCDLLNSLDLIGDSQPAALTTTPVQVLAPVPVSVPIAAPPSNILDDLDILGGITSAPSPIVPPAFQMQGQASLSGNSFSAHPFVSPTQVWLPMSKGKGLELSGIFRRKDGQVYMDITFSNKGVQPLSNFAIQFNKNSFGLVPGQQISQINTIAPNTSTNFSLPVNTNGPIHKTEPLTTLQVAIKNSLDIFYFTTQIPMHVLFIEDIDVNKSFYLNAWKEIPAANEAQTTLSNIQFSTFDILAKLNANNIFTINKQRIGEEDIVYLASKLTNGIFIMIELKILQCNITISLRSRVTQVYPDVKNAVCGIINCA